MPAMTNIGGFFAKIGLEPDKNSFETGNKLIDTVANSFNKLISSAKNAAVVLAGTAVATGVVESSNYKTATAIGISTEALNTWKAAAKIAGVDANGLVSSMGRLSSVMGHLQIDGQGLEAYSDQLWKLGLGINNLENMEPDQAFKKIFEAAHDMLSTNSMTDVALRVKDVLGEEAMNFFIEIERQGKTIDQFLLGASKTQFTTNEDNQKAADFAKEVNTLKVTMESIGKLLGSDVGGVMTPYLQSLNSWIQSNGEDIKKAIENVSSVIDKILGILSPYIENIGGMVLGLISGNMEMASAAGTKLGLNVAAALTGTDVGELTTNYQTKTAILNAIAKEAGGGFNKIKFSDLSTGLQNSIIAEMKKDPKWKPAQVTGLPKVKDGIIRPDGTVTQVAPDDWVFAVRSIGDMAKAFIPQGITQTAGNMEFSIVQNFTISGGNDMPQVLRQQAYNGTQEGLLAAMAHSSQRLQLMSGTR